MAKIITLEQLDWWDSLSTGRDVEHDPVRIAMYRHWIRMGEGNFSNETYESIEKFMSLSDVAPPLVKLDTWGTGALKKHRFSKIAHSRPFGKGAQNPTYRRWFEKREMMYMAWLHLYTTIHLTYTEQQMYNRLDLNVPVQKGLLVSDIFRDVIGRCI